jgi:predicted nucleic acid-binding protein
LIVVADTSPLNYIVLIGAVDVVPDLYNRIVIPQTVAAELCAPHTPAEVRAWLAHPPAWLDIVPDPPSDGTLNALDPGERAAITLAFSLGASRLLIDDFAGRAEAERLNLQVTGTLGVLAEAHRKHLLNFDEAVTRLTNTTFYLSPRVVARVRRLLSHPDN